MKQYNADKYVRFYGDSTGRAILKREVGFIESNLAGCEYLLSVGCGPGVIEGELKASHRGMEVVGIDISPEMLDIAGEKIEVVVGDAKIMPFKDRVFDCLLFLTSLEFMGDYRRTIDEGKRVLKANGRVLAMILNPESYYFAERYSRRGSYIHRFIKHMNINGIRDYMARRFSIKREGYFLGIKDGRVYDTTNPKEAGIYFVYGLNYHE